MKKIISILLMTFLILGCTSCQFPKDDLNKLEWPDHKLVNILPKPKSTVGEVQEQKKDYVRILVGRTKRKDYLEYIEKCKKSGFDVMKSKEDNICNLNHKDGYTLSLTYNEEDKTMIIAIKEKTYQVSLETKVTKNLLFSRYDVLLYLDDKKLETMEHGTLHTFDLKLKKGKHTLRVEKADDSKINGQIHFEVEGKLELKYDIFCNRTQIQIEPSKEKEEVQDVSEENMESIELQEENIENTEETDIITAENDEQFAAILALKDPGDPSVEQFVQEHLGGTISFCGNIAFASKSKDDNTRFDYLIYSGDYNENSVLGPNFQIRDAACEELHIAEDNKQKHLAAGTNIQITAELEGYDSPSQTIRIHPLSITIR